MMLNLFEEQMSKVIPKDITLKMVYDFDSMTEITYAYCLVNGVTVSAIVKTTKEDFNEVNMRCKTLEKLVDECCSTIMTQLLIEVINSYGLEFLIKKCVNVEVVE